MSPKDILNENNEKKNSKKCEIKGFILDIDGTLLNSKQQHLEAWKRTLEKHGIKKSEEEIIAHFGKSTLRIAQELVADKDDDNSMLYKQIADEKTKTFYELIPNIKLFEGVQETLEKIHDMGYKIAFASSNYDFILEIFMKTFGWGSISVGFVGIDSITHAKPHPEMIMLAFEKIKKVLNIKPEECVMIGDSSYDIEAGKRAGVKTIGVLTGKHTTESFLKLEYTPDLILEKFSDLADRLPLFL